MIGERNEQRRLAAIMFTDMVGFSALAQRDEAMALDYDQALRREAQTQSQLGFSHDYLEGAAAFLDKRAPVFKDR